MSLGGYIKSSLPEYLLCLIVCIGLGLNVLQGFHIPDEVAYSWPFVAAVSAVLLAALHVVCYSKKSLAIGIPVLLVVAIVATVVAAGSISEPFADSYDNPLLAWMALVPTVIVVFLLSRKQVSVGVLFVVGTLLCGVIQFLYGKGLVVETILFLCACTALYAVRRESRSHELDSGKRLVKLAFCLLSALLVAVLAAAASAGVFFAVVAPLNPPAVELKLITEHYALEEVHVSGLSALLHQKNDDSAKDNDQKNEQANEYNQEQEQAQGQDQAQENGDDAQLGNGSNDMNGLGDPMSAIRYFADNWWILVVIAVVLAVLYVGLIFLRRTMRRRRLQRYRDLGPASEVQAIYAFVCSKFAKIRLLSTSALTPYELAVAAQEQTERFEKPGESATFAEITEIFVASAYGNAEPGPEDLEKLEAYYALFPKRTLSYAGRFRYIKNFFRV